MVSGTKMVLRVAAGGRVVIPAEVRRQLGVEVGSEVLLTVEHDCAILMSPRAAIRRAQQLVRQYIKPGVSLSAELMAERKREAERE